MAEADPRPEYRCLMCTSPYKEPRLLPCGHTFCCRCLTSYIEAEHVTADEDRHFFPCPVCEAPINPDDGNTAVSTWATCFLKNDFLVSSIAQSADVLFCAPCLRWKESNPAEVTCTECEEKLCKQCRICHERNKATAAHRLVSISGNVGQLCDVKVYEICHQHSGKPLDVYCVDHSAMCCSICVSVSHRQCNNVKPMEDVIKKTMAKQSLGETEWKELTEETKKMLDEDDLGITTLNAREKEVSAEMTDRIQKAKDKLDNLNARFQSDLAGQCRTYRQQLLNRRKNVNTFHINAENSHLLMSRSDQQLSERHRFFVREQTKSQISGHYRRMDQNTKKETNQFDITLKLQETIDEIMKMTTAGNVDVTSTLSPVSQNANGRICSLIGSLLLTPSASAFSDSTSTSDLTGSLQHLTVQTTPVTAAVDVWTGSVSCVHTVNTSTLRGERTPWLMGGIFTDNNELLITDYLTVDWYCLMINIPTRENIKLTVTLQI
ncbi:tripartite motif-containing protein 45-like [Pecten maximus]|uniref:tripartite motif-containing protein 45-like n=1 Tax=Pecten maximus TaxID=6579 RepID=UPI001458824B|nr:tripartite motif-containing protein 45-like [Pecten maximus]